MRERAWTVHLDGHDPVSTGDLDLDEVELIERVSAVPYTLLNPHASVRVAKAMLVVVAMRGGMSEEAAVSLVRRMPLRGLHGAFVYTEGDERPDDGGTATGPPPSATTSANG